MYWRPTGSNPLVCVVGFTSTWMYDSFRKFRFCQLHEHLFEMLTLCPWGFFSDVGQWLRMVRSSIKVFCKDRSSTQVVEALRFKIRLICAEIAFAERSPSIFIHR
jgi:hypothetical protein